MYGDQRGILKKALEGKVNGKRPRDRPRQRWTDRVNGDLNKCTQGMTTALTELDGRT